MAAKIEIKRKPKETPNRDAIHTLKFGLIVLLILMGGFWAMGMFQ